MFNRIVSALPALLFVFALMFVSLLIGMKSGSSKIGPYRWMVEAKGALQSMLVDLDIKRTLYYQDTDAEQNVTRYEVGKTEPGLTKIASAQAGKTLAIQVIDFDGDIKHQWDIDWFQIWPNAEHLSDYEVPKKQPGTHVHGSIILDDGSIVFNFEHLGLVRLNACGDVIWRLPYRTHHSVTLSENDTLWVSGHNKYDLGDNHNFKNMKTPITEDTLLEVSLDGLIIQKISLFELLGNNHMSGLLYMSSNVNYNTTVTGDILHLNDIDVFPTHLEEGVFKHGDIMVSLRNINSVIVFNPSDWSIRYASTGRYLRQHDPDFISGNTFTVIDNNNLELTDLDKSEQSAILVEDASNSSVETYYGANNSGQRFYTSLMGKHQWLANGNMLIASTLEGRVLEISPDKEIVWEYYNLVGDHMIGFVGGAERLPESMDENFFAENSAACRSK